MAQASQGYFGIAQEVTAGTSLGPTHLLPVKDVDFTTEVDFIEIREIRGSRQAYSMFDGPLRPSATFTSSVYPDGGYGYLLKGLFGSVVTGPAMSSVTAKTHTFGDATTLKTFSIERSDARADATGGILHERMVNTKVESIGFTCNYGEDVEMSVSMQGLAFPEDPASKPLSSLFTTPVQATGAGYPIADPMIFTGATVAIDGNDNAYFKSVDFDFTNTLERQESLRGTREAYLLMEGGLECSLSGTMIFADSTIYDLFKNSTYCTVTVVFQGASIASDGPGAVYNKYRFHWPKVKVSNYGIPMTAGEVIEADVEFAVSFDSATQKLVDVQLTNLVTSLA
jgi:hypothetical protein